MPWNVCSTIAVIMTLIASGVSVYAIHEHGFAQVEKATIKKDADDLAASKAEVSTQYKVDQAAAKTADDKCTARVDTAQKSAETIKTITEPSHAKPTPEPQLISSGELRNALNSD